MGPRRDAETMRRDQHCKERVERIFTPRCDRLVQWLRVLKVINPEYANVEILKVAPPEVVDVKPPHGKPSSVIKTRTTTELGPSFYRAGFTLSRFYTTF